MSCRYLTFLIMMLTIFFFAILITFSSSSTTPTSDDNSYTVLRRICSHTQALRPQSFDVNFVDTMEVISQKISQSGFGFASFGDNSSNQVYGLGQCFNYLTDIECRLCYAESRVKLPLCLPSTSGGVYLDGCFLRYSDYNFSQEVIDGSEGVLCGSSKNESGKTQFAEITSRLIQNLTSKAYEEGDYYKEGKVLVSSRTLVYGVAECWKSVNKTGCKECLENARRNVVKCLPGSEGRVLNAGCYLRYSTEPFYLESSRINSSSSGTRQHLEIALALILTAVVIIGGVIVWGSRRSSKGYENNGSSETFLSSIRESQVNFKYNDLRKSTNEFDIRNKIGQGGYGSVYKGILGDGREIAVKRLYINTNQWTDQFFNEVNLISQVQHKNLVKLLGCSIDGPESLLVYEYLCNSSLDQFLFDPFKKVSLDWERRFEIIVGTAEGLNYLHESSEVRIIHRDIKASNVLLDGRFKPKIADFGLARCFTEDQSHLSTGLAGTLGYMAPEYVVHGQLTEKADVYSYGILVFEIITGHKNTRSISTSANGQSLILQIWEHFNSKTLIEMLDHQLQGQCSEEEVIKLFNVGLLCIQASPSLRPPMWKVVEMLNHLTADLPVPTQPPYINIKGVEFNNNTSGTSVLFSLSSSVSVNEMSFSAVHGR